MGLFDFLAKLFLPGGGPRRTPLRPERRSLYVPIDPLRWQMRQERLKRKLNAPQVDGPPYRFAEYAPRFGKYYDLSQDGNPERLSEFGLPEFQTPEQLAEWLQLPVGKVAWLCHRFTDQHRPATVDKSHYYYRWLRKRSGGLRLVEAPKPTLKLVQRRILREILDRIPLHQSAHGFARGRSIVSNAAPHTGQRVVLKFDLEDFYANVSIARVIAIFRSIGYSREVGIWLARLTTSALPHNMPAPEGKLDALRPYAGRHLPQGAPTSPALANLSAFSLDVRLSGMARSFKVNYTRYADDLTFSGPQKLLKSLRVFIPLVSKIIRSERFIMNRRKRKVIRSNQRQTITGVVVNERTNVARKDFDRLKAILTNCHRLGPLSQNHGKHPDFAAHLAGRIAHVQQLNANRGAKLRELYGTIDWQR